MSGRRGGRGGGDRGGGGGCFKCGRPGHFARECPTGGGSGGGDRGEARGTGGGGRASGGYESGRQPFGGGAHGGSRGYAAPVSQANQPLPAVKMPIHKCPDLSQDILNLEKKFAQAKIVGEDLLEKRELQRKTAVKPKAPIVKFCERPKERCTKGRAVKLLTNHWVLQLDNNKAPWFQYDVIIYKVWQNSKVKVDGEEVPTLKAIRPNRDDSFAIFWNAIDNAQKTKPNLGLNKFEIIYNRDKIMLSCTRFDWALNGGIELPAQFRPRVYLPIEPADYQRAAKGLPEIRSRDEDNVYAVRIKATKGPDGEAVSIGWDLPKECKSDIHEREREQLMPLELLFREGRLQKELCDRLMFGGRSFYDYSVSNPRERVDLGCGREMLRGFYLNVRVIDNWQITLNPYTTASVFYKQIPVPDFAAEVLKLSSVPNSLSPPQIRALGRVLKEYFNQSATTARKHRKGDSMQRFTDADGKLSSVADYFRKNYPDFPILQPGLPVLYSEKTVGSGKNQKKRKNFYPMELCWIHKNNRVKQSQLDAVDHTTIINKTCIEPDRKFDEIENRLTTAGIANDQRLQAFNVTPNLLKPVEVDSHVLDPPTLEYRGSQKVRLRRPGEWAMYKTQSKCYQPCKPLKSWAFIGLKVERSEYCSEAELRKYAARLSQQADEFGIAVSPPFIESRQVNCKDDISEWFKELKSNDASLQLIMIAVPKKGKRLSDDSEAYGAVKHLGETLLGIPTQVVQVMNVQKANTSQLNNMCLKINPKLGGTNVRIANNVNDCSRLLYTPILLMGADVTHPDPGDKSTPSIAAICGNVDNHPDHYLAIEQVQAHRCERIEKLMEATKALLVGYYTQTKAKPARIIYYRDGVSEGQFRDILHYELCAIQAACQSLERDYKPGVTFVIVQKRHQNRFFNKAPEMIRQHWFGTKLPQRPSCLLRAANVQRHELRWPRGEAIILADTERRVNITAGTVVDSGVTHPVVWDFFMASHIGMKGTSKATHYHVLWDDNRLSMNDLCELTYHLCHTYARCTRSVSIPTPCYYAHLIAFRARTRLASAQRGGDAASTSGSSDGGLSEAELQGLIKVHKAIQNTQYWQ